jgi:hypothetical protein
VKARWILGALAALVVAAVIVLAVVVPRIVDRPEVRARIEAAARKATGRELTYASLSAELLPPAIEVVRPTLAADVAGAPPLFTADHLSLRLELLPLLGGAIVLDRLRVDGAHVHWVRVPGPAPDAGTSPPTRPAPASDPGTESPSAAAPALGIRNLDVENAQVTIEDRTVSPPATLALEDIDAKARAGAFGGPVAFDMTGRLASGGDVAVTGTATTTGEVDATATLSKVEARPFAIYLGKGRSLAGLLSGTVHVLGPAVAPSQIDAKLAFQDAAIDIDTVRLHGKLAVSATLANASGALGGPFEIDATEAELAYAGSFRKPPGTVATTSGTLRARPGGGFAVDEVRVKIKNFEAHGSLETGAHTTVALDAAPFDLSGWEQLLPGLAKSSLGGRLSVDGLRATTPPPAVDGAVILDGVRVALSGQPPVVLRGRLAGAGNAIRSQDLSASVAGQPIALSVGVAPLDRTAVGSFSANGSGLDTEALLSAFSTSKGTITGPLRVDARFQAPLASGRPILDVVTGTLDFSVGPGNFRGVSVLKQTIERSGPVVQAAVAAGQAFGGRDVKRMYDDRFESIGGVVNVGGGTARFDPIRAVYRDYRLDVRGRVRLADRSLDASGLLVFADAKGAGAMRGQTLPISHIYGTLDAPRVELSPEDLAVVVARASGSALEQKLQPFVEKLEKGVSGGGSPIDALKSLFGGKKRK